MVTAGWQRDPIDALKLIKQLTAVKENGDGADDYEGLVAEVHAVASMCLDNADLIDITSDKPLS